VRCSSCEPVLDRYVEGTLTPREMASVTAHLRLCRHCESLLHELRVVDALLATTKPVELAPNFTFAVMAEARAMRLRPRRSLSIWAVLSFYVVGAWIALSGVYAALGGALPYFDTWRTAVESGAGQAFAALSATAHGIVPATPLLVGGVVGVLLFDALLAVCAFFLYRAARARLVSHMQRSEAQS
jgi:anti-sigma factor RsiW